MEREGGRGWEVSGKGGWEGVSEWCRVGKGVGEGGEGGEGRIGDGGVDGGRIMSEKQPIDNLAHARRPPTAMYSVIGHYTESPSLQSSNLYQFPPKDAQGDKATSMYSYT